MAYNEPQLNSHMTQDKWIARFQLGKLFDSFLGGLDALEDVL